MTSCLQSLFTYFENVLHPAAGWSDGNAEKKKRKSSSGFGATAPISPESFNMRGLAKKQDKVRHNPAP